MVISNKMRFDHICGQLFGRHKSNNRLWNVWPNCKFSSNTKIPPPASIDRSVSISRHPPLSQNLPGVPKAIYATVKDEQHKTQVTTLPNGLRVASENRFGQFCTVGVVIDSGSRYEVAYPCGISHFLEKLAFSSTIKFKDKDKILFELEKYGGICDSQSSRDVFVYAASADSRGIDTVARILAEVTLRPRVTNEEVNAAKQTVQFELESLLMRPEQEPLLMDMIHAAAYKDNTLGLPKICPAENINIIDRSIILTYLKHHYTPQRMVVAGVGVDHDKLVDCINKYFVDEPPIWADGVAELHDVNLPSKQPAVDHSIAQYTGGIVQEECEIPLYAGPSGLPELAHIVIGFEGCSHQNPDFIPICVLNTIMGGGGSFSAGGPGKGMYTRLYTNVLNRYHWMYSATAYNHTYNDTGLFCIHASAPPPYVKEMVQVIVQEMLNMAGAVCPVELRRAKTQLQSMLLMNLESRTVVFEDMARQVLATNHRKPAEFFIDAIEKVTEDDIVRVAKKLLRTQPAVAARGDINKLPSFDEIQSAVMDMEGPPSGGVIYN
ncbi:UNVERIFIED_CONTAM: hypothetical protein PYX00_003884 [Menopon gallinae]|uniref:Mitochondrial-processing peptidase subunit alpha n=1 Tax=Menopon gallinae TaxID=328185 RepID=A0AAW2I301_9NEOP